MRWIKWLKLFYCIVSIALISAFARHPNGKLSHYYCYQREDREEEEGDEETNWNIYSVSISVCCKLLIVWNDNIICDWLNLTTSVCSYTSVWKTTSVDLSASNSLLTLRRSMIHLLHNIMLSKEKEVCVEAACQLSLINEIPRIMLMSVLSAALLRGRCR